MNSIFDYHPDVNSWECSHFPFNRGLNWNATTKATIVSSPPGSSSGIRSIFLLYTKEETSG